MKTNDENQTIFQFINSKQIQAIIVAGGLIVALVNLYIATKLSPLVSNINSLEARATHTDTEISRLTPRAELEAIINPLKEDVVEIKGDIKEIRNMLQRTQ